MLVSVVAVVIVVAAVATDFGVPRFGIETTVI